MAAAFSDNFEPGTSFDHTRFSWLVIWEAGVIIELPPWVALLYPSSLFFHFNVDVSSEFTAACVTEIG